MMKKIFGLCVLLLGVGFTLGFDIPAYDGYVTDKAEVLTLEQEQNLEDQIFGLVKETSAQMGILIIPSTEGEDIAMLATDIGNKRGVGEEKYDNGIIMVIAIEDRERFIAVGYGLEGTIPDAIAKRIGEADFPDNFRAGNYYDGIVAAVSDLYAYIKNDPTVVKEYQETSSFSDDFDPGFLVVLLFVLAGVLGQFITSPDPKDKKKRRMTKKGWIKYAVIGGILAAILFGFRGAVVRALVAAYGGLGVIILLALAGMGGGGRGFYGGGSGGSSFGGSSFGGFGGGSFGGGGGGGRR